LKLEAAIELAAGGFEPVARSIISIFAPLHSLRFAGCRTWFDNLGLRSLRNVGAKRNNAKPKT
jgi:hypothetical protein